MILGIHINCDVKLKARFCHKLTLAVSGFSATMNMKLRLTKSAPLQMQMMQPSKSDSVLPVASNDDRIFGSWHGKEEPFWK